MKEDLIVGAYLFSTASDAELAREEQDHIEYLDRNMNYSNTAKVMQLYEKALDSKMFRTPIGWEYLNKLRSILEQAGFVEAEIRPVPLYTVFARIDDGNSLAERVRPSKPKSDPFKRKYIISVMIIVILLITVISMFVIALKSETPNMINYRNTIVNEYASWEQDIKNREDAVRAKERELSMPSPLSHDEQNAISESTKEN